MTTINHLKSDGYAEIAIKNGIEIINQVIIRKESANETVYGRRCG